MIKFLRAVKNRQIGRIMAGAPDEPEIEPAPELGTGAEPVPAPTPEPVAPAL